MISLKTWHAFDQGLNDSMRVLETPKLASLPHQDKSEENTNLGRKCSSTPIFTLNCKSKYVFQLSQTYTLVKYYPYLARKVQETIQKIIFSVSTGKIPPMPTKKTGT